MDNLRMAAALKSGDCLDVDKIGTPLSEGVFQLSGPFNEDLDYCQASTERWVWSVGQRKIDGVIFASLDTRYYMNPDFTCLWLR